MTAYREPEVNDMTVLELLSALGSSAVSASDEVCVRVTRSAWIEEVGSASLCSVGGRQVVVLDLSGEAVNASEDGSEILPDREVGL